MAPQVDGTDLRKHLSDDTPVAVDKILDGAEILTFGLSKRVGGGIGLCLALAWATKSEDVEFVLPSKSS